MTDTTQQTPTETPPPQPARNSHRQTLAEAKADAEYKSACSEDAGEFGAASDWRWRADALDEVATGEVVTPEMEALAKIPSEWVWEGGGSWRGRCPVCKGVSSNGLGSIIVARRDETAIRHADGCVMERARQITGANT